MIGYSAGRHKDAELVKKVFASTDKDLQIEIFHMDRGKEFENKSINEVLEVFKIKLSLSKQGCP